MCDSWLCTHVTFGGSTAGQTYFNVRKITWEISVCVFVCVCSPSFIRVCNSDRIIGNVDYISVLNLIYRVTTDIGHFTAFCDQHDVVTLQKTHETWKTNIWLCWVCFNLKGCWITNTHLMSQSLHHTFIFKHIFNIILKHRPVNPVNIHTNTHLLVASVFSGLYCVDDWMHYCSSLQTTSTGHLTACERFNEGIWGCHHNNMSWLSAVMPAGQTNTSIKNKRMTQKHKSWMWCGGCIRCHFHV